MPRMILFRISDKLTKLLQNSCSNRDLMEYARELFLHGLSAAYQAVDDDTTAKEIEKTIVTLRNLDKY